MTRWTREDAAEYNEDMLFADGFDAALMGVCLQAGRPPVAAYSIERMLQVLAEDEMDAEEALEYLEFNTFNAYVGPSSPVFLYLENPNA